MTTALELVKVKAAWYYLLATFVVGFLLGSLGCK